MLFWQESLSKSCIAYRVQAIVLNIFNNHDGRTHYNTGKDKNNIEQARDIFFA